MCFFVLLVLVWQNVRLATPIIEKKVKVIDKRTSISRNTTDGSTEYMNSHNYLTFETEDGDRMELLIKSKNFGLIVVGDVGKLKYQGTRFLDFYREK